MVKTLRYITEDNPVCNYESIWIVCEAWRRGRAAFILYELPPSADIVNEAIDWLVFHFPKRYKLAE